MESKLLDVVINVLHDLHPEMSYLDALRVAYQVDRHLTEASTIDMADMSKFQRRALVIAG